MRDEETKRAGVIAVLVQRARFRDDVGIGERRGAWRVLRLRGLRPSVARAPGGEGRRENERRDPGEPGRHRGCPSDFSGLGRGTNARGTAANDAFVPAASFAWITTRFPRTSV